MSDTVVYPRRPARLAAAQSPPETEEGWLRPQIRCFCILCRKTRPNRQTCERLAGNVACKQCCIKDLDGHRCHWWDLCWSI